MLAKDEIYWKLPGEASWIIRYEQAAISIMKSTTMLLQPDGKLAGFDSESVRNIAK
jgi:hypothetical protein